MKAAAEATASPSQPKVMKMPQAKGRAASDPQVPGAFGKYPAPNHVAIRTPGLRKLGLFRHVRFVVTFQASINCEGMDSPHIVEDISSKPGMAMNLKKNPPGKAR